GEIREWNTQMRRSDRRWRKQFCFNRLDLGLGQRLRLPAGQRNQLSQVIVLLQLQLLRKEQPDIHKQQDEHQFDPVACGQCLPADPAIWKKPELWSSASRSPSNAPNGDRD